LDYDVFVHKVFASFTKFKQEEIWGVRKVCIENLASLMKHIKKTDLEKLRECIEFFKKSLSDGNRWVRNQALI